MTLPNQLKTSAAITFQLDDTAQLSGVRFDGLRNTDQIRQFAGVRDDPFIFPDFFGTNVIAAAFSIPVTAFPEGQQDFVLWGTTHRDGELIDVVGRGIRSQLPRFALVLNQAEPPDQLAVLSDAKLLWDGIYEFFHNKREWWSQALSEIIRNNFQLREFDLVPDVLIYSNRLPVGFPNGRQLPDDIVAKLCTAGDCLLVDLSLFDGAWPRAAENDKEFLDEFPYLAEQWPYGPESPPSTDSIWPYIILLLVVLAVLGWLFIQLIRALIGWLCWLVRGLLTGRWHTCTPGA